METEIHPDGGSMRFFSTFAQIAQEGGSDRDDLEDNFDQAGPMATVLGLDWWSELYFVEDQSDEEQAAFISALFRKGVIRTFERLKPSTAIRGVLSPDLEASGCQIHNIGGNLIIAERAWTIWTSKAGAEYLESLISDKDIAYANEED